MTAVEIPAELRQLLETPQMAFVATYRQDGEVSVVPVSPMLEENHLWLSAQATTRKVKNLQRDPRVTLCVVDRTNPTNYVQIRGRAVLTPDRDRAKINAMARFYMNMDVYPYDPPGTERMLITIKPEHIVAPRVHGGDRGSK